MENYKASNYIISLISGGLAGLSVDIALFPIDTLKSRLQFGKFSNVNKSISSYKGILPTFLGSFPSAAMFFLTYDYVSYKIKNIYKTNGYNPIHYAIAASVGECFAVIVRNPFELIKQNQQVGIYNSMSQAVYDIYNTEGIKGFYRGYVSTLIRDIPFSILQFPIYESFKYRYIKFSKDNKISTKGSLICGGLAGALSAIITTPFDVIKTRIMTNKNKLSLNEENKLNLTNRIKNTINEINKTNKALYFSGVHWRTLYISIGGVVFFGTNEYFKKLLNFY